MHIHDLFPLRSTNLGLVLAANILVQILHIGEVLILRWYLRGSVIQIRKTFQIYLKRYSKHWLQISKRFCISDIHVLAYCMVSFHIPKVADKVARIGVVQLPTSELGRWPNLGLLLSPIGSYCLSRRSGTNDGSAYQLIIFWHQKNSGNWCELWCDILTSNLFGVNSDVIFSHLICLVWALMWYSHIWSVWS